MKKQMTICLIVNSDEGTLDKCLSSFAALGQPFKIGYSQKPPEICKKYTKNLHKVDCRNMSAAKNEFMKDLKGWVLWIEPYETLLDHYELDLNEDKSYYVNILNKGTISKQMRLWHTKKKLKFRNPVHEFVEDDQYEISDLYFKEHEHKTGHLIESVNDWYEREPLSNEAFYYKIFNLIFDKNWPEFLKLSNYYIFKNNNNKLSTLNLRYSRSAINCHVTKNYNDSVAELLICLSEKPYMAEYWCLLGDLHCEVKDFEKAASFYRNAIHLGTQRPKTELMPMEIDKYKKYPQSMIVQCEKILSVKKQYVSIDHI